MTTNEMKPCPFCKGSRVSCSSMLATKDGWVLYLKCPDCKASFRVLEHVYNTRPIEEAQTTEIAIAHARITEVTPANPGETLLDAVERMAGEITRLKEKLATLYMENILSACDDPLVFELLKPDLIRLRDYFVKHGLMTGGDA